MIMITMHISAICDQEHVKHDGALLNVLLLGECSATTSSHLPDNNNVDASSFSFEGWWFYFI
jgi:hypothetical protein